MRVLFYLEALYTYGVRYHGTGGYFENALDAELHARDRGVVVY